MTTVLFESHATSLDNDAALASGHFDVPLSAAGERQARELGERYRGRHIDEVFCSDLQRSYRTAELACAGLGIAITRDPRLRECDYGALTRRSRQEVHSQLIARLEKPFPAGESYRQAADRVKRFLCPPRDSMRAGTLAAPAAAGGSADGALAMATRLDLRVGSKPTFLALT
jgi:broad specificity phosphatase PhoE